MARPAPGRRSGREARCPGMPRSPLRPLVVLILAAASLAGERGPTLKEEMKFGVEAAEHGLWREAIFRWEKFLKDHPDNPRLRNNLAVAYESLGEFGQAEAQYKEARRLDPENKEIRDNYTAFQELYKSLLQRRAPAAPAGQEAAPSATPAATASPAATPQPAAGPPPAGTPPPAGAPAPEGGPAPTATPGAR